jgi:hypothetical protein
VECVFADAREWASTIENSLSSLWRQLTDKFVARLLSLIIRMHLMRHKQTSTRNHHLVVVLLHFLIDLVIPIEVEHCIQDCHLTLLHLRSSVMEPLH